MIEKRIFEVRERKENNTSQNRRTRKIELSEIVVNLIGECLHAFEAKEVKRDYSSYCNTIFFLVIFFGTHNLHRCVLLDLVLCGACEMSCVFIVMWSSVVSCWDDDDTDWVIAWLQKNNKQTNFDHKKSAYILKSHTWQTTGNRTTFSPICFTFSVSFAYSCVYVASVSVLILFSLHISERKKTKNSLILRLVHFRTNCGAMQPVTSWINDSFLWWGTHKWNSVATDWEIFMFPCRLNCKSSTDNDNSEKHDDFVSTTFILYMYGGFGNDTKCEKIVTTKECVVNEIFEIVATSCAKLLCCVGQRFIHSHIVYVCLVVLCDCRYCILTDKRRRPSK